MYELGDTLLILLARRPLTLLHVYHHALVIAMCYLWLATRQSLMPVALVTNAAVHVVMYAYYLCCTLGLRWPPRWKRAVTELQILQFLFSFAASVVMLWFHFAGGGCEGMAGWAFNAVFNASLLALFLDFHGAAYAAKANKTNINNGNGGKSE
ncbi:Elongation of fatty acids protein 2 [Triticum urartu]|nr:Elongation of fatty acids protein 2 [Triticum urartu]